VIAETSVVVREMSRTHRPELTAGSPYAHYLGSFARIARLQSEHMRLCLNSYALKAGPDEDELVGPCYRKAIDAAMSTIQTHYESSQTDLALSFATDVSWTRASGATSELRLANTSTSSLRSRKPPPF